MPRHAWAFVAFSLLAVNSVMSAERIWTDSTGRSMRAEFVREIDGEVTFLKDGKIVTLPLNRLSERDQQVVRDLAAGKPVAEDPQPAAPSDAPTPAASSSEPAAVRPADPAPTEAATPKPLVKKPVAIENRTWTDIHGNQVTGKYVRIFGSNVVLLRGGKSVTVKFYELSSEDQEYLRELLTSRGQEGLIPPKVDLSSLENGQSGGAANDAGGNVPPGTGNAGATSSPDRSGAAPGAGFPGAVGSPPVSGPSGFPNPSGSFPQPSGPSFPGSGSSFPGPGTTGSPPSGPGSFAPSPSGPGSTYPPGFGPPVGDSSAFPSNSPPGMPGSGTGSSGSSFDRLHQQLEQSRQQQLDSFQQMQDRMNAQHESLFNRHGSTGECLNCKHSLNDAEMRMTKCPHCGVTWDYEIDEFGHKRDLNNSSFTSPFSGGNNAGGNNPPIDAKSARMIGLVVGVFIGLAVVAGVIIGTIYIIMSIASASSSSQQRYYR